MTKLKPTEADLAALSKMLRKVDFFSVLSVRQIEKLIPYLLFYGFKKGESIIKQGGVGDAFYIVLEGQVQVRIKRRVLWFSKRVAVLGPGDFFGEMALLDRVPRMASVRSLVPSRLFALTYNDFDYILQENPSFAEKIRKIAARRKSETAGPKG